MDFPPFVEKYLAFPSDVKLIDPNLVKWTKFYQHKVRGYRKRDGNGEKKKKSKPEESLESQVERSMNRIIPT